MLAFICDSCVALFLGDHDRRDFGIEVACKLCCNCLALAGGCYLIVVRKADVVVNAHVLCSFWHARAGKVDSKHEHDYQQHWLRNMSS